MGTTGLIKALLEYTAKAMGGSLPHSSSARHLVLCKTKHKEPGTPFPPDAFPSMEVRSIEAIVTSLNDAKVQYLIVGGLAVVAHGYERLTRDVDLVIGLEPDNIIRGLRALMSIDYRMSIPVSPEDFASKERRESWRQEKGMVVLKLWSDVHRRTPIDVFIYEPFDFQREYESAKWEVVMGDVKAPVVTFHTLIEMKRLAGRPQDLADITDLEEVQRLREDKN